MAWQAEVGSGTGRALQKHDFLTKKVGFMTSQHVATVVVAAGGTGYVDGEILTLTHGGALLDARFEVTAQTGGIIDSGGLRIVSSGAFSNRVTTVAIGSTAGTGYAANDVVEITTGSGREKAKVEVLTVSAGVPLTVGTFETGGAYGTAPGATNNATRGVGPTGFAGDDALNIDVTMTGLIGLSALSTTASASGINATVDITLAQTGWTVDDDGSNSANTNDLTHNSITNEKQVRLVGDAAGFTNKPYVFFMTGTETSGVDTRHFISLLGGIAHNPSLSIGNQPGVSPGRTTGDAFENNGSFLIFPENEATEIDFWFQVDDLHGLIIANESPNATTDNGRYLQSYFGFIDRLSTEVEDPYPYLVSSCTKDRDVLPSISSDEITGLAEQRTPGTTVHSAHIYKTETASWDLLMNNDTGVVVSEDNIVMPFGEVFDFIAAGDPEAITFWDGLRPSTTTFMRDRSSPTQHIQLTPGTTAEYYLFPLSVVSWNSATNPIGASDFVRGNIRGAFAIYNTDAAGSVIANFSEDFITIGTARYRIFHNHVHTARYQYIAVLEDV